MSDHTRAIRALIQLGGDDSDVTSVLIPWAPASKSRPRFGRGGRAYTPAESRAAEARTAAHLRTCFPEPLPGNVALACIFYRPDRQRIDADNMLKHLCDAANGIIWQDDSQVTAILGIVELDIEYPRTVMAVSHHDTTMTRGADSVYPCAQCGKPISRIGRTKLPKTCSPACAAHARGFFLLSEPVDCAHCGEPFKRRTAAQKMCSPECRVESLRNRRKSAAKPMSECLDCGIALSHTRGGRCRNCWRTHLQASRAAS